MFRGLGSWGFRTEGPKDLEVKAPGAVIKSR